MAWVNIVKEKVRRRGRPCRTLRKEALGFAREGVHMAPAENARLHGGGAERPLWVISGHTGLHEKASALPLKQTFCGAAEIVRYVPEAAML